MDCTAGGCAPPPRAQCSALSNQMVRLHGINAVHGLRRDLPTSENKKSTSNEVLYIFNWWWEMDCTAGGCAPPRAQCSALSNLMVRLCRRGRLTAALCISPHNKKTHLKRDALYFSWWWEMDSNHRSQRQQIYSLPPLATRESHRHVHNWSG